MELKDKLKSGMDTEEAMATLEEQLAKVQLMTCIAWAHNLVCNGYLETMTVQECILTTVKRINHWKHYGNM